MSVRSLPIEVPVYDITVSDDAHIFAVDGFVSGNSGIGWWFDRIFKPAQEGLNNWHAFQFPLATRDIENEEDFEVGESLVPHLTRDQIVEFASEYPDPDERAIRIFGDVRGRQGLVYKQYRHTVHKIPRFDIPPEFEIWGGLDPGFFFFASVIGSLYTIYIIFMA